MHWNRRVEVVTNPRNAVIRAREVAGADDLICIAGSLYLVGAVRPLFTHRKARV